MDPKRRREWEKEYREKNREKINARVTRWRKKNRERLLKRRAELRNRPEAKEKDRIYRQRPEVKERDREKALRWKKTERGKEYHISWYKQNRDRLLKLGKEYHARPEIKVRERKRILLQKYGENGLKVFERDSFACQKCSNMEELEVHHIDWDKTNNNLENLAVLCDECHIKLHKFIPLAYRKIFFEMWMKK